MSSRRLPFRWTRWASLVVTTTACTHEVDLMPPRTTTATLAKSASKRIAVVMGEAAIKPTYETSTDGHTWIFRKAPAYYRGAFAAALRERVGTVEFFDKAPVPPGFDAYIYPTMALAAHGALPHQCKVEFTVAIVDVGGRPVVRKVAAIEESFMAVADAERACSVAMSATFNATAYVALASLDAF
jgi:hypothetical protein